MVEAVLLITLVVETAGALLSFPVFLKDYSPLHALGISIFHSVASFNNAGFDILGNMTNLIPYRDNVALNLITSVLVIVGGIGFPVILDLGRQRNFRRLTLHTKVVLVTTGILLAGGTLLLKLRSPSPGWRHFSTACLPEQRDFPPVPWEASAMGDCS